MTSLVVIDTEKFDGSSKIADIICKSGHSDFLFLKRNDYYERLINRHDNVSEIDLSVNYQEILDKSRESILSFFSSLPNRRSGGKNFHERFSERGHSPWWFMNFADKAPDAGGLVNRLFHLDIIDHYIKKKKYDFALIVSEDVLFEATAGDLFAKRKISSRRHIEIARRKCDYKFFEDMTSIFIRCSLIFVKLIFEKILCIAITALAGCHSADNNASKIAFHSWYPSHWVKKDHEFLDKYYSGLPAFVSDNSLKLIPFYMFKLKWYEKKPLALFDSIIRLNKEKINFDFSGRYVPVLKTFFNYLNPFRIIKYFRAESDLKYINNFEYIGINIFNIASGEVRESYFFDRPYNEAISDSIAACIKSNKIAIFVNFLELYAYSRAIISKLKSDQELSRVITVAFQHSTITRYNLHFNFTPDDIAERGDLSVKDIKLPFPDHYILSGPTAEEVFTQCGFDKGSLHVTGSPRYDSNLKQPIATPTKYISKNESHATKVLIATVSEKEESRQILEAAKESFIWSFNEGLKFSVVVKMHPMCDISDIFDELFTKNPFDFEIALSRNNIYNLLHSSDFVITSNSMTGLEALILGKQVALFGDPTKINLSPLASSLEFSRIICYSKKQFTRYITNILKGNSEITEPGKDFVEKLIEEHYFRLDGKSNERILKLLEEIYDNQS